jgi:hypothetical protein
MEIGMRLTVFLSCLALAVSAQAQTQPKVVFLTDTSLTGWIQSPSFTANNWVGAAIEINGSVDPAAFQTQVVNQNPAYVFVAVGTLDMLEIGSSVHGPSTDWGIAAGAVTQIVKLAQAARINVILGNVAVADGKRAVGLSSGDLINTWLQTYSVANSIPVVNFEYWLQNGCYEVVATPYPYNGDCDLANMLPGTDANYGQLVPTALGYQFMTRMAQTAIATYGLTIKGGYLADVMTDSGIPENEKPPAAQVNTVTAGAKIQFTPQATWSDGVTRPMLNSPYGEAQGIWWSTNPNVLAVNQHGVAYAYSTALPIVPFGTGTGTAQVWFQTSTGHTFSPWGMTVVQPEF